MDRKLESDQFDVKLTDLDFEKLNIILETVSEEYENYLTSI